MRFQVRALSGGSAIIETEVEAGSESEARNLALARGLAVLSIRGSGRVRGRARFPLLLFNQELLALLRAGIPLAEAVAALAEKENRPGARGILQAMLNCLREGRPLSSALE